MLLPVYLSVAKNFLYNIHRGFLLLTASSSAAAVLRSSCRYYTNAGFQYKVSTILCCSYQKDTIGQLPKENNDHSEDVWYNSMQSF